LVQAQKMAQVKACTVAIGLVPISGFKPVAVLVSGFFAMSVAVS